MAQVRLKLKKKFKGKGKPANPVLAQYERCVDGPVRDETPAFFGVCPF